jgi:hypothetical protein
MQHRNRQGVLAQVGRKPSWTVIWQRVFALGTGGEEI